MEAAEVIRRSREIVVAAGRDDPELENSNFLDHAELVRDIIQDWPKKKRDKTGWLKDFAVGLRKLRDDFADIVAADPMVIYKPAHKYALEFHASDALIRYFRAPNRTSKTQTGVADNYWVLTGQHPYRKKPPLPAAVAVIGVNFTKYAPKTFIPKYVTGETGNPLSPVFPKGGKWFNRFQEREKILHIACPECANAGKALSCKHPKSTLTLFSDVEGPLVLAGAQYSQIQLDEQISHKFLGECLKRLETVPNSGMMVTETPLGGKGFWTHTVLTRQALDGVKVPGESRPLVSLHTLSQYEAGLSDPALIEASEQLMTKQEAEARVYGRPAAFSETAVFDNAQIGKMLDEARDPLRCSLLVHRAEDYDPPNEPREAEHIEEDDGTNTDAILAEIGTGGGPVEFALRMLDDGPLRIWEKPKDGCQYVIGADVAEGLTSGDASCAQVLKVQLEGHIYYTELVASLHGWINSLSYASDLFKLGLYYNCATLVVERRGPGDATIQRLKELGCWFMLRDQTDPANAMFSQDPRFGLDTNVQTKGVFVSVMQNAVWDRSRKMRTVIIPDRDTLDEMGSFGQEATPSGMSIRFRGEAGMHDDRVMALMIAQYAATHCNIYDFDLDERRRLLAHKSKEKNIDPDTIEMWRVLKAEQERELRGAYDD